MARQRRRTPTRRQRIDRGHPRQVIGASTADAIRAAVDREARRFAVSRSFVIAVALADALSVDLDADDDYRQRSRVLRLVAGDRARR